MRSLEDGVWKMEFGSSFISSSACVNHVHSTRKSVGKMVDKCVGCAHVVFATNVLSITKPFIRTFSEFVSQAYTLLDVVFNRWVLVFVHTIHTPNNRYYKGD